MPDLGNLTGPNPAFVDLAGQDYHPAADSVLRDAAGVLGSATAPYPVSAQNLDRRQATERSVDGLLDIGAYEW